MKILFVTSEAYPLIKTGGLADVSGALPAALAKAGDDIRIMLPAYPQALDNAEHKRDHVSLGAPFGRGEIRLIEARMPGSGVPVLLVDCPVLFGRKGNPYTDSNDQDWPDNHLRFATLARAAAIISAPSNVYGWAPDVVHANDWQTGLVPAYLRYGSKPSPSSLFTIHNMQYQGLFPNEVLRELGLPSASYAIDGLEFHNQVSFLKAGLCYSDALTTVSPTYAREIQTLEQGCGMDGVLRLRNNVLTGLLNGIDTNDWNPATDDRIPHTYSVTSLSGKAKSKAQLQREMGLAIEPKSPLFCMVSRLTDQKGIDMVMDTMPILIERGAEVIVLGTGDKVWENALKKRAAQSPKVHVVIGYNEDLAHRIIAASDVFMMPSRFEPCGLTQMYALRYGTLPLVRNTGGLADSVVDISVKDQGTGFVFDEPTSQDMTTAVKRALEHYASPMAWKKTQNRAMSCDLSWALAAQSYKNLYTNLISSKKT